MSQIVTDLQIYSPMMHVTLGVLKPCYTVEKALPVSRTSTDSTNPTKSQVRPTQVGNSFLHCKMNGITEKLTIPQNILSQRSNFKAVH